MPSLCCLFITICNCRTACKGQGIRDPLRSHSNKPFAVPWEALSVKPDEHAFALDISTRCEITWFNFDTVLKRFHALLPDLVWIKKCIPQVISFQLLSKEILEKVEGFDKDDWPLTCEQLATSTREWLAKVYTCYGYKFYWETRGPGRTEKEIPGETESEKLAPIEKKSEPAKEEVEEAHVEPIPHSENRGGKKRGLLDTCK